MDAILLFTILARENASLRCLAVISRTSMEARCAVYWRLQKHKRSVLKIARKWININCIKTSKWHIFELTPEQFNLQIVRYCQYTKFITQLTFITKFNNISGLENYLNECIDIHISAFQIFHYSDYSILILYNCRDTDYTTWYFQNLIIDLSKYIVQYFIYPLIHQAIPHVILCLQ